jgi:hypothetical protein
MVRHIGGKKTRKSRQTKKNTTRKHKKLQIKVSEPNCIAEEMKQGIFGENEFNSGDGMLTTVWGPSLWHTLHTISFNYPVNPTVEDKKNYQKFICSLRNVLPCKYCRMNLKNNFKSLPPTMEVMKNRATFSKYIYDLHELVNKMLKKRSNLSYCDVKTRYEHFRSRCTGKKSDKVWKLKQIRKTLKNSSKKEKGCTTPLYSGEKSKCIIKIVPQSVNGSSFQMDKKCEKKLIMDENEKKEK